MKKRIVIFGNGYLHEDFLKQLKPGDHIVGVDRAAYWLLAHEIIPHVAIGDFDSTTRRELQRIKKTIKTVKMYPSEKDATDMELATAFAASLNPSEVFIFGATGTRLDHMLANLHLRDNQILIDRNNKIRLIGRGRTIVKRLSYRYISILPYTKSIRLSLTGFRYNVDRKILKQGSSLGVSNEIAGKSGSIKILSGKAWVIESND